MGRFASNNLLVITRWLLIMVALLGSVVLIWRVPKLQLASFKTTMSPKDTIEVENSLRLTLAQIIGGALVLVGLYFTWRTVDIAQQGQITQRFTSAIEQMGDQRLEVRLGGIYALERIARDSRRDHWPMMEVLTACIRKGFPSGAPLGPGQTPADLRAVLTVIARRKWSYETRDQRLDLSGADLRGTTMHDMRLNRAILRGACLDKSDLSDANLESADLAGASLSEAVLDRANLIDACLQKTILKGARLTKCLLSDADLSDADISHGTLQHAHLPGANLERANLAGADLTGANLVGANLSEANLEDANARFTIFTWMTFHAYAPPSGWNPATFKNTNLRGACLENAQGLTQEQISKSITDAQTVLPERLHTV